MNNSTIPLPKRNIFAKIFLFIAKFFAMLGVILLSFYLIIRYRLYRSPNAPHNTQYVQYVCRKLCHVFNVKVQVHGTMPRQPALWVSNHISWLDIPVLGAGARVFFLAKAEIKSWPIIGKIATWGGTLYIKRGSGDSDKIKQQITQFLQQDIPVLFFPEATTGDGKEIRRIYGRLLSSAIAAQRPVNLCVLCYVNAQQQLDQIVPLVDKTFVENVIQILQMDQVVAHILVLPSIDTTHHTIETLTAEVQQQMTTGLAQLHAKVLSPQN